MPSLTHDLDYVFCGTVVHSTASNPLEILEKAALGIKRGKVAFLDKEERLTQLLREHEIDSENIVRLKPKQFMMPGLVDCHIHSPQLPIQAVGTDRELLDWLNEYTFPTEAKFHDHDFASVAHRKTVLRLLRGGTTCASYYSTIHTDTTLHLFRTADELGQRALVGKVNMDMSAPDYYRETTEQSIEETERFIKEALSYKSTLVKPVITPRFAISCSQNLMTSLGHLAKEYDLPVQTHLNESVPEIEAVHQLHPGHNSYSDVYDAAGLLGSKTILAHCVHMSDRDIDIIKGHDCGLVHCACSNNTLRSGLMDIRQVMDLGLKVALGTDMAGGYTTSMLSAMRHAIDVSNICAIRHSHQQRLHKVNSAVFTINSTVNTHHDDRPGLAPAHTSSSSNFSRSSSSSGRMFSGTDDDNANNGDDNTDSSDLDGNGGRSADCRKGNGVSLVKRPSAYSLTYSDDFSYQPLTMAEAFRLATLNGAVVLGQNCGNFEPGKEFDGLLVDPEVDDTPIDLFDLDTVESIIYKFLYHGDDRNMVKVFVQGRNVVSRPYW